MKLDGLSIEFIKDLYMLKVRAVERNDQTAINHLKEQYPEIFNAEFLIDILRNYFEKNDEMKNNPNIPLQKYMTKVH